MGRIRVEDVDERDPEEDEFESQVEEESTSPSSRRPENKPEGSGIMSILQKDLEDLKMKLGEEDESFDALMARARDRITPMKRPPGVQNSNTGFDELPASASESFDGKIRSPVRTPAYKLLSPFPSSLPRSNVEVGRPSTASVADTRISVPKEVELMQQIIDNQSAHIDTLRQENEFLRRRLDALEHRGQGSLLSSPGTNFVADLSKKIGIETQFQQELSDIMDEQFRRMGPYSGSY